MKAEVISIGTELLLGDITDTNATFIAQSLRGIGLDLLFRTTVGDNEERIAQVIDVALNRADIVITTGGLGPTVDDVTREAIARATGRPLEFHQALLDQISERFRRFGVKMTDNNHRQAYAPSGALLVENPVGTAPVFILETERGTILTLPGVPREMEYLLDKSLLPWLKRHVGTPAVIKSLTLRTAGIGESQVDSKIADLMVAANPSVGLAAHSGQTDIRITAKAGSERQADELIEPIEAVIRSRVGDWVYGTGTEPLEDVVVNLLEELRYSLATMEQGTHAALSARLNSHSHKDLRIVSTVLDEPFESKGSSVQESAELAAQRVRLEHQTTLALAVILDETLTGSGKSTEIGIAIAGEAGTASRSFAWSAERTDEQLWVTTHALAQLWRYLVKASNPRQA